MSADQQDNLEQTDSNAEPAESAADRNNAARLTPPRSVWVVIAVCVIVAIVGRGLGVGGERAVANVLTLICGFIAFVAVAVWFLLFSGYRFLYRLLALAIGTAAIVGLIAVVRVDQVTGDLMPTFGFRWSAPRDQVLGALAAPLPGAAADMLTTTAEDYPQFLGPNRDLRYDRVAVEPVWNTSPPRLLWRHEIGAGWSAFSIVNGYATTLEQRGDQELVTCYEARTGNLVWSHAILGRHSTVLGGVGPRSTPTIHEGRVYTLGATGVLHCLDGASGAVRWREDLLQRYRVPAGQDEQGVGWGRAASPLIVDNLVVVPAGGPKGGPYVSLAAFDNETGKLVWQAGDRQVSYSSPVLATLAGRRQIVIVNENNVTGHDPADGHVLWNCDWPGGSTSSASVSQPAIVDDSRILLSKGYGGGSQLLQLSADAAGEWNIQTVWREPSLLRTKFTNVVLHRGHVYGLSDGVLECVTIDTGKRQWKRGRYGHGQILGVADLLLVQAEDGTVALVEANPEQFREIGSFPAIEGKTWNNLCLFGSLLLVRNAEEAACYELAVRRSPTLALR